MTPGHATRATVHGVGEGQSGTLTLYRSEAAGCWMADWSQTAAVEEIRAVLGTDQVPMPFTCVARAETVLAAMRKHHPKLAIMVVGEGA